MNLQTKVLVLALVLSWGLSFFLLTENVKFSDSCKDLIPYFNRAVNYYNEVCAEDINRQKLEALQWQLLRRGKGALPKKSAYKTT
jgi:hypothetical protein